MDLICESCGVANPQGTEFCEFCGVYLAWDRSVLVPPRAATPAPVAPSQPPSVYPPHPQPEPTTQPEPITQPLPPVDTYRPAPADPPPALGPESVPPAGAWPAQAYAANPAPAAGSCPTCGRVNDPSLRFCAKCGQVLSSLAAAQQVAPSTSSAWGRISRSRDRAARRAYRRSLPPLYRWRRVIIAILVVALGLGGLRAVGRHPVRWAVEHYDDLRNTTVIVPGVKATVDPPTATAQDSNPAALTDLSVAAWTMSWAPAEQGASCGGAPGTGVVVLTTAPTRIREIDLQAGLLASDASRPLEFRPESIGVSFDGGPCHNLPLQDIADWQVLKVDSGVAVSTVRIGVDTAFAARPDGGRPRLSITEIVLRSRPMR